MRLLPFLQWWPKVNKRTFKADIQAGVVGALVVLPQGMAFASIAGMPPEYGLFTGIVPTIIAALFGSSWLLVSGPSTAASLVLFSSLSLHAEPGSAEYIQLALTVTLLVGFIQLGLGLVRFGSLVDFISHSVIAGFTTGAAILIIASQSKYFLGLSFPSVPHFQEKVYNLFLHFHQINPYSIAIGVITICSGVVVKKFWPALPNLIISMLAGSGFYMLLITVFGKGAVSVEVVGALPGKLPPFSVPDLTMHNIKILAPTALAMTLFCLTEAISIARTLSIKTDQDLDGNQEFVGQGLSNIIGCFFSGYVATGSFNRSGINYEAGAKTPLAAIFAGLFLIPVLLYLAPWANYLPKSALAGLLFLVAWHLLDIAYIKRVFKTSSSESLILCTTFLATLFLEMQFAILLGIMTSLAVYLKRTSHPQVLARVPDPRIETRAFVTDPSLPECPQLKILRIDGSLYFGAIHHTRHMVQELCRDPGQKHLLIISSGINFIDMAGEDFLLYLAGERRRNSGALHLCDVKQGVCSHCSLDEFTQGVGQERIYKTKNQAISRIFAVLDKNICAQCTKRIFKECESVPFITGNSAPDTD